jgi:N-acetylated-alpha-linked acidic dipeptidase
MGFGGDYGVYHSAYDSFYWMSHFGDPTFVYHVAAAQLWGTIAMRLADADGLPFDYTEYANQLRDFFTDSVKLAKRRDLGSAFDEKAMADAVKEFAAAAFRTERDRHRAVEDSQMKDPTAASKLMRINDALIAAERAFIDERGLRGRPWYKHEIYAPGVYTGYAAQPLTDFAQAIDDRNAANAKEALGRIVESIKRATVALKKASE